MPKLLYYTISFKIHSFICLDFNPTVVCVVFALYSSMYVSDIKLNPLQSSASKSYNPTVFEKKKCSKSNPLICQKASKNIFVSIVQPKKKNK